MTCGFNDAGDLKALRMSRTADDSREDGSVDGKVVASDFEAGGSITDGSASCPGNGRACSGGETGEVTIWGDISDGEVTSLSAPASSVSVGGV